MHTIILLDPEWDGEPIEPEPKPEKPDKSRRSERIPRFVGTRRNDTKKKIKVKLRDGKEREIQHMISTSFWSADGKPISAEEFLQKLFGKLPEFFKSEDELRKIWSNPVTRRSIS